MVIVIFWTIVIVGYLRACCGFCCWPHIRRVRLHMWRNRRTFLESIENSLNNLHVPTDALSAAESETQQLIPVVVTAFRRVRNVGKYSTFSPLRKRDWLTGSSLMTPGVDTQTRCKLMENTEFFAGKYRNLADPILRIYPSKRFVTW